MATRIQVRRDTLANWNLYNPTLSSGEIAFVTDQNKIKVGDGSTSFTSLGYLEADAYVDSVILGTDTTGNYVQTMIPGDGISLSGQGSESASVTVTNSGVISLTGTTNEVEVSASTGNITLSLPETINSNTTGTAASLSTARIIALSGDVSGSVTFDGSASVDITTSIQPNSVSLGADTTGNYVATASAGAGISISGSGSESAAISISNTGVTSLTGTASQISVSASSGDVTLSLPSAVTFPGTVTLNANPTQALQAATKQYVDAVAEGLHVHASVDVATTASVDISDAPTSIDNVSLTDGMRILVKNQSNLAENGIYTFSASADALVRAADYDTAGEIDAGDFVFVSGGDTYNSTGWVQENNITTLGTDPIVWDQFSGAGTYSAGTGLLLDGTVFSNTGVLSLTGTPNEIEVSASSGNITIGLPSTITAGISLPTADTASAASHYLVEVASDGILRPKTLSDVKTEIVTNAAVNAAAATTVGTISSGIWEATDIGLAHGGTNASLTAAAGAIVYSTSSALALTGVGEVGQVLTSNGAGAPTWQAPSGGGGLDPFFLGGM